jgi:glycosyltransferase involved in cell wall biosynthesis
MERAVEALGLSERVELLGHRDDVADLIAAADVLVSSSTREGAAGAVIEAMAIGTPIVSTMLPGLTGVLETERNALTVAPHDVAGLAGAIDRIIDDTTFADRIAVEAHSDFEARFTLEQATDGMIALYRRCAPGARPGPPATAAST